jgi:N-acetylneuraminic acid mutarotase
MNIVNKLSCRFVSRVVGVTIMLILTRNATAQDGNWSFVASLQVARTGLFGGAVDGKIYSIGGSSNAGSATSIVEEYDPLTDIWIRKDDIPNAITFGASAASGNKIYLISGAATPFSQAKNTVYAYDPGTDTLESKMEIPTPRILPATAVVDGKIYVIGGSLSATSVPVTTVELYDPETNSWTERADMITARYGLSASVVDGKIYAIGGTTDNYSDVSYATVEEYDPESDTWTTKKEMPSERWGLSVCTLDNKIYAIGGQTGFTTHQTVEVYDPKIDNWETISSLQMPRRIFLVAVLDGKIYAIAGSLSFPGVALSSVEEFSLIESIFVNATNQTIPIEHELYQNFPNPFNPTTTISYAISLEHSSKYVRLDIYNLSGQKVRTLVNQEQSVGYYSTQWDGRDDIGQRVSSGPYLYRLKVGNSVLTKRMLLIH